MIGTRIKLARKQAGLSLRELAEKMNGLVSAQAIGKYERGEMTPSSKVLIKISKSLGVSIDYLLSPNPIKLESVEFRKIKINAKEKAQVESKVLNGVERYLQIEKILGTESKNDYAEKAFADDLMVASEQATYGSKNDFETIAEERANQLRKEWGLGLDPIPNMTKLLEERGFKVLLVDLADKVSGLTCQVEQKELPPVTAIVVNKTQSLERRRFTMAHELGHRIIDAGGLEKKDLEKACNRFAGAFLVNGKHLIKEIGDNRSSFSYRELMDLKRYYRVSACALLMRLEQVGVIDEGVKQYMFRTVAKNWRKEEPEPLETKKEKGKFENPCRFEQLVYRALAEDMISPLRAAELLQQSITEVEEGLKGPEVGNEGYN